MPTEAPPSGSSSRRAIAQTPNTHYGIHKYGYILGKTLGTGAYAKVKAATSLKGGHKEVAVKIIDKKAAPKDVVSKFLPREIEVLKGINHENVVKLFDVIDGGDNLYLIMELATSGDLLDFINSRRYLSERVARKFFTDIVNGIEECHSLKIVHRDLKCENLILDANLNLKISDFGFARRTEGKHLETYCGSYAYAAPEVILGHPYDGEAADIWSMGVILFAMLVGKLPFKDSDVRTLLSEISSCIVFPSRLGDEVKHLITSMLTFSVVDRAKLSEIKTHPWMKHSSSTKESVKKASVKESKTADIIDKQTKQVGSPSRLPEERKENHTTSKGKKSATAKSDSTNS